MPRFDSEPAFLATARAVATARDAIAESPGWVRVGLTFGNERLREEALTTLAATVVERLENPPPPYDADQLPLAL
ncbi:DUF6771 family protein [Sphingomonas oligophenolica]|uniref:DUF6771 family protein n=1 Tax=Sphingomonas oligophenolica TaxID=301154 RepID=A0ABU9Y102_9SPHN